MKLRNTLLGLGMLVGSYASAHHLPYDFLEDPIAQRQGTIVYAQGEVTPAQGQKQATKPQHKKQGTMKMGQLGAKKIEQKKEQPKQAPKPAAKPKPKPKQTLDHIVSGTPSTIRTHVTDGRYTGNAQATVAPGASGKVQAGIVTFSDVITPKPVLQPAPQSTPQYTPPAPAQPPTIAPVAPTPKPAPKPVVKPAPTPKPAKVSTPREYCPPLSEFTLALRSGSLSYTSNVVDQKGDKVRFDESYNIFQFGAQYRYLDHENDFSIAGLTTSGKGNTPQDSYYGQFGPKGPSISGTAFTADYKHRFGNAKIGLATQLLAEHKSIEKKIDGCSTEPETTQTYLVGAGVMVGSPNCDNFTAMVQGVMQPVNYAAIYADGMVKAEQDMERYAQFTLSGRKRILEGRGVFEFNVSYAPKIKTVSTSEPRKLDGSALSASMSVRGEHFGGFIKYATNQFELTRTAGTAHSLPPLNVVPVGGKLGTARTDGMVAGISFRF